MLISKSMTEKKILLLVIKENVLKNISLVTARN